METVVVLSRKMGNYEITQRTSDGYFDANALLLQWNADKTNPVKRIAHFTENDKTDEFINEIKCRKSDNAEIQPLIKTKGRLTVKGKTPDKVWMHPFLFIDFAMWLSPSFKYDVIKFVYDELIRYRNEAGDAYREMSESVAKLSKKGEIQKNIIKVAEAINFIAQNDHSKMIRNQASEIQMKEYVRIEKEIVMLVNKGFIKTFEGLMEYLRSEWRIKYQPALFNGR